MKRSYLLSVRAWGCTGHFHDNIYIQQVCSVALLQTKESLNGDISVEFLPSSALNNIKSLVLRVTSFSSKHVGISRPKFFHLCELLIGSGARQKGRRAHFNSAVIGINKILDEELTK